MPVWGVSEPFINLWIQDEPLAYQPGKGPRVALRLSYKQRDTAGGNPNIFSFGTNWNSEWLSYVVDFPSSGGDHVKGNVYLPGGGMLLEMFTLGAKDTRSNYLLQAITNAGVFTSFQLTYPNGAVKVFGKKINALINGRDTYFLTASIDPAGNQLSFVYTNSNTYARLTSVIDADGRTNTLNYSSSVAPNLVSSVSDAFGRTAYLNYDANLRLTGVTDVAGLTSSFGYDAAVFNTTGYSWITNLTTPYGTTSFKFTDATYDFHLLNSNQIARAVQVLAPDGGGQLFLYRSDSSQLNLTNATPLVPSSYAQLPSTSPYSNTFGNTNMNLRNSFSWGSKQFANLSTNFLSSSDFNSLTVADYNKAGLKHWLQTNSVFVSDLISMQQDPSPDGVNSGQRTWFDYVGKPNGETIGTQILPLSRAWLLPDGSSAYVREERSDWGSVTAEITTSSGGLRTNTLVYASNGIDLLKITDALGQQVVSNAYNGFHQVSISYNALQEPTTYQYDSTTHQLTNTLAPNTLNSYRVFYSNSSDTNNYGFLQYAFDIYRTNSFTYASGLVKTSTNELGTSFTNYWDNLQRLTGRQFWDQTTISNVYYKRDGQAFPNSSGGTNLLDLTGTKDRLGNWTYFNYDSMRRKVAEINTLYTNVFVYCNCGSLSAIQYPTGSSKNFYYDALGRLTNTIVSGGGSLSYGYDLLNRLITQTDGVGVRTNYYNNQGLLSSAGNSCGQLVSMVYDLLDRPTNTVDASGITLTNSYDALGRLLVRGKAQTNSNEQFFYSSNIAGPTSYTNPLGYTNLFTYDALGRKTSEVSRGVSTNSFTYDPAGNLKTLVDGNTRQTAWSYDKDGRLYQKTDATNNIYTYTYFPTGWLSNRVDSLSRTNLYDYDVVGNLTRVRYLNQGTTNTYAYDLENRLSLMTDAIGISTFGYLFCGEYSLRSSENPPWQGAATTIWYYPPEMMYGGYTIYAANQAPVNVVYVNPSATRFGSVISLTGTIASYTYLGAGNSLKSVTFPGGAVVTNTYDGVGRLTETRLNNGSGTTLNLHQYAYNAADERTSQTRIDGSSVDYAYDTLGQLSKASGHHGSTNRWHEQFGYAYDAGGNLSRRTNNTLVQTFTVNSLNELSSVSRSGALTVAGTTGGPATNVTTVTVADNGNTPVTAVLYADKTFARTNVTILGGNNTFTAVAQDSYGRIDTNSVTLSLPSSASYTYDANGNLTADGRRTFSYDQENQLASVTATNIANSTSTKTDLTYDGLMRLRIRRESNWQGGAFAQVSETRYIYDGQRVVQERDGNNNPTVTYTWGVDLSATFRGAGGIGGLLARTDNAKANLGDPSADTYYHADGNGNITAMINASQTVVARYTYDPYGNTLSQAGPMSDANVHRFSSKEYLSNSGLYYYGYRLYDPNLQRWLNRDPIQEQGGINLYAFVLNDPIDRFDRDGLRSKVYGAGKLCVDSGCKPNACKAKYLDEDDWKKGWLDLPKPGGCVDADAVAFPSGVLKIPDNCRITLICEKDGSFSGSYRQTCYGILRRPVWDPPGFPPNPFPQAKLVFGNVLQASR